MKTFRVLGVAGLVAALAAVVAGCPIYDEEGSGSSCYGQGCIPNACTPPDCGVNETCGNDGQCHVGDCSVWGCVEGYTCVQHTDSTVSCEPNGSSSSSGTGGASSTGTSSSNGGSGAGGATSSSSTGGGGPVYCGNPGDCPEGQTCAPDGTCQPGDCTSVGCIFGYACDANAKVCKPTNPAACGSDSDCASAGPGYACVSGICTAPADQCFDQGQCPGGDKCASGKCTPACTKDADCAVSYACDTQLGLCTKPAKPCTITNDCGGPDAVCVDGACVPRSDGANCPSGTVWVENGCIPTQSASFLCSVDGQQDACAGGSICLHHACYISCEPPNGAVCDNLPSFNQCKSVTTTSGAHQVCGSSSNLGNECDPTVAQGCANGKVCIDGYCK